MSVKAKFKVQSVTSTMGMHWDGKQYVSDEVRTIRLFPVSGGTAENAKFFASTPSGSIDLGTVVKAAAEYFALDGEYYVTFERAEVKHDDA
jgi:hypothetical protein